MVWNHNSKIMTNDTVG